MPKIARVGHSTWQKKARAFIIAAPANTAPVIGRATIYGKSLSQTGFRSGLQGPSGDGPQRPGGQWAHCYLRGWTPWWWRRTLQESRRLPSGQRPPSACRPSSARCLCCSCFRPYWSRTRGPGPHQIWRMHPSGWISLRLWCRYTSPSGRSSRLQWVICLTSRSFQECSPRRSGSSRLCTS